MTIILNLPKVSKITINKEASIEEAIIVQHSKQTIIKKVFLFEPGMTMINLSLKELKLIAKNRGIRDYENKSEDELIKIFSEPKIEISLSKRRIKEIKEKFNESRYKFLKSKINDIRRNIHDIKNTKSLSASKTKEIEKNLLELENNLFKPNKYYDYNDTEYKGIRDARNLFNLSIDKDCYKPIRTNYDFTGYIEYESNGDKDKDKTFSIVEYLNMIRPYLRDIINNHKTQGKWKVHSGNTVIDYKTQGEWKIQLSMKINFMFSKDADEICTMHTMINNVEIMMCNEINEIIKKLFNSLLQKYQEELEESMKGSEFIFDNVDLLYYKLQKHIDSPKWLKNKKATVNFKNKDKCFQYTLTVALNYQNIEKDPQRISRIKSFIDQYNWKEIHFPPLKEDWKKFE